MTNYVTSIVAAAIFAGMASVLSPEKWRKYVGMITGIVIICIVISPIMKTNTVKIFDDFNSKISSAEIEDGEKIRIEMISTKLEEGINRDIEQRMKTEFDINVKATAEVGFNDEGKVTGVNAIKIKGKLKPEAAKRLCEVYGIGENEIKQDN